MVQTLEIQDDMVTDDLLYDAQSLDGEKEKSDQQIEVQVLQSGQIEFSAPSTSANAAASSVPYTSNERDMEIPNDDGPGTISNTQSLSTNSCCGHEDNMLASPRPQQTPQQTVHIQSDTTQPAAQPNTCTPCSTQSFSVDVCAQPSAIKNPPLIIRRNKHSTTNVIAVNSNSSQPSISAISPVNMSNRTELHLRRSSRRHCQKVEEITSLRHTISPPPAKRARKPDMSRLLVSEEVGCDQLDGVDSNPLHWGVEEVLRFISSVPRCNYVDVFRDHASIS